MRKRVKKAIGMMLWFVVITQLFGFNVMAEEYPNAKINIDPLKEGVVKSFPELDTTYETLMLSSDGIFGARIYLSYDSNGLLAEFTTTMSRTASEVGVKSIVISQEVWYGWKQVGTSSGGHDTNKASYGCGVTYSGASAGQTFKASCVHYGIIDGVTYERPNETSGFTCVDPNN